MEAEPSDGSPVGRPDAVSLGATEAREDRASNNSDSLNRRASMTFYFSAVLAHMPHLLFRKVTQLCCRLLR
ncbi:hypothetical protein MRX96_006528 [Rhipicephalus microplus]